MGTAYIRNSGCHWIWDGKAITTITNCRCEKFSARIWRCVLCRLLDGGATRADESNISNKILQALFWGKIQCRNATTSWLKGIIDLTHACPGVRLDIYLCSWSKASHSCDPGNTEECDNIKVCEVFVDVTGILGSGPNDQFVCVLLQRQFDDLGSGNEGRPFQLDAVSTIGSAIRGGIDKFLRR